MPSLFTELRRRNVFKVGAAYAIVAWLLLQITDIVLPTFEAPLWVAQTVTFLLIIGFPITLLMAWAFEMTPEGIKADADVQRDSITPAAGQRLNYVILGLVVLAVGFLVTDQYVLDQGIRASVVGTGRSVVTSPEFTPDSSSAQMLRFTIDLGENNPLGGSVVSAQVAVSPDGSRIVYAKRVEGDGAAQLYMRSVNQFEAQLIAGAQPPARDPFFSPNGEWVGFNQGGMGVNVLKRVSVRGGPSQTVTDLRTRFLGASWGTNDTIVYSGMSGLNRVPAAGGVPDRLLTPEPGTIHSFPEVLPGGNAVLFAISEAARPASEGSIAVHSYGTDEYVTLIEAGFHARYAPTGHIVFARTGSLWAVPFDPERLEITGTQVPVVEGVQMNGADGFAPYGFSDDGLLVYVRGGDTPNPLADDRTLVWVDREGQEEPLGEPGAYQDFNFSASPDGRRVAVVLNEGGNKDIKVYDSDRGTLTRFTFDPAEDDFPLWTPDGERLVFWSLRDGGGLFSKAVDGTGQPERLTTPSAVLFQRPDSFSPDRTKLTFTQGNEAQDGDLHVLSLEGERTSQPLLQEEFFVGVSAISPDGRWIAYTSDETGEFEVYVRPFPEIEEGIWQVSRDGGAMPRWAPQSQELFYRSGFGLNAAIMVAPYDSEPNFSSGNPRELVPGPNYRNGYDISLDGQRFLMLRNAEQAPEQIAQQTTLAVVHNWFEELIRLAPPSP